MPECREGFRLYGGRCRSTASIERRREYNARYRVSEEGRASQARYNASTKGRARYARYFASDRGYLVVQRKNDRRHTYELEQRLGVQIVP